MKGFVENADFTSVSGWALDPERPDEPVFVDILDGEVVLLRTLADEFRPDLVDAGLGSGRHGFRVRLPEGLLPGSRHVLRVRFVPDGRDLPGSPRVITRPLDPRDSGFARDLGAFVDREIGAARTPDDLAGAVSTVAGMLDRLLEARAGLGERTLNLALPRTPSQAMTALLEDLAANYPPVALERPAKPDLSLVLPARNQFDAVYQAVASLAASPSSAKVEVIVVDDGSEDPALLASLVFPQGVRMFRNPARVGWTGSVRAGVALAVAPLVLVLDPAAQVDGRALDELVDLFARESTVGVVSPVLVDGDGRVAEYGRSVTALGELLAQARGIAVEHPSIRRLVDVPVASTQAMAFRRTVWTALRGLAAEYDPAGHHEADFCYRARAQGWRVVASGHAQAVVAADAMERWRARWPHGLNARRFLDAWGEQVEAGAFLPPAGTPSPAYLLPPPKRRVLFVDERLPTPDQDAGSLALVDHMASFRRLGYDPSFMAASATPWNEADRRALERRGVRALCAPYVRDLASAVSLDARPFDVVYFHRYPTAEAMADEARRLMPEAQLILNVADLHHLRRRRGAELSGSADELAGAEAMEAAEIAAIRKVDSVLVHAGYEERLLRDRHRITRVGTVPWSLAAGTPATNWPARRDIAFIGGFLHQPNRDAADMLVRDIMPLVREAAPGTRCLLIGSHIPADAYAEVPDVVVVGQVASIPAALASVRFTVAPLRYGAGIKGKVLSSLAAGVPCLMSPVAREGLALTGDLRDLAVDRLGEMAQRTVDLLQAGDDRLDALGRLGLRYIAQHHTPAAVDAAIGKLLRSGQAKDARDRKRANAGA